MSRFFVSFGCALVIGAFASTAHGLEVEQARWTDKGAEWAVAHKPGSGLVWIGVVVRSGTANVGASKEGLPYFAARAVLRGTKTRSYEQISDALGTMGTRVDVRIEENYTLFYAEVLARYAPDVIEILGDAVTHPAFESQEIERLRGEVLGQVQIDLENDGATSRRFLVRELHGSSMGGFPRGTRSGLRAVTADDIRAFHRKHYVGANLLLTAAGDMTMARFSELTREAFADVEKGAAIRVSSQRREPIDGIRFVLVDKPGRTQNQIYAGNLLEMPDDPFPLMVANNAFGGRFGARLNKEIRVKRGWSYGAYSNLRMDHGGYFMMWTYPANEDTMPTLELLLELYRTWHTGGITAEELAAARSNLANVFAFRIETPDKLMQEWLNLRLRDDSTAQLKTFQARARRVDLESANEATRKATDPAGLVIVMVCTADDYVEKVKKLAGVREVVVIPYDAEDPDSARKVLPSAP